MNELRLLQEHRDRQPGPSPAVIAEARARLTATAGPGPRRARHRRRYAFAAAGVLAATAVAVVAPAVVDSDRAPRAYAVERQPNGTIRVTLREFSDSRGLERKLRSMGVSVAVEYQQGPGQGCQFPRGRLVQHYTSPIIDLENPPRRPADGMTSLIHPEMIKPGQTLVWSMKFKLGEPGDVRAVGFRHYLVEGPVKPCH